MKSQYVSIGDIDIGPGLEPIFLPDIDMFFNGDLTLAKKMVDTISECDLPIIKGAVLHRATIALDDKTEETYYNGHTMVSENYRALMERKVISLEQHESIFNHCKSHGLALVLSVYDFEGAAFAKDIGAVALKIPSSNITHAALIEYCATLDLPLIIDTGKSTLEEIARAYGWAFDARCKNIVIEHSPDAPPAKLELQNLKMIKTLSETFSCPVGLSDHYNGDEMMYAAVALGANIIEKGIYPDGASMDQDVFHALPVSDIQRTWKKCQNIFEALGSNMRILPRCRVMPKARMGLIAKQPLASGSFITHDNTDFSFPAKGVAAEHWHQVNGWKLKNEITAGQPITWQDIEYYGN